MTTDIKYKQTYPQPSRTGLSQNIVIEQPGNITYKFIDHGQYIEDSTTILRQLEESGQMENVIMREVTAERKQQSQNQGDTGRFHKQ